MKIALGKLEKSAQDISSFLAEKLGTEVNVEGGELEFESQSTNFKNSQVKTYLKRYLYLRGHKGKFRASAELGSVRILELKNPQEEEEKSQLPESKAAEEETEQKETPMIEEAVTQTEEAVTQTEEAVTQTEEAVTQTEEAKKVAPKKRRSRKKSPSPDSD